ncbi:lysophospholipid acyltransferase family protein [Nakamurella deserti]|uniref:lysophospholipid acyltransferase family protein n=1 Tax=Nakamurella deserti TaxID=2164074 RepID=UPI00197BCCFA|nr:lysophospholipid acyltransferase family protein [Nakamurella deserti]
MAHSTDGAPDDAPATRTRRSRNLERDNGWIVVCRIVFYPLTALLGRRRFRGMEHLQVPAGALLVANHVSHLDPVYDAVYVRKAGRWPHFMAKASIWKVPGVGTLMRGARQIPVERSGGAGQQSLQPAIVALNAGRIVVIYPDGTITRDPDTWPMRPKAGVAVLALAGDFPVIPVVNWGTQHVFVPYVKKGRFRPWPRKDVVVAAGPPIDLSAFRGREVDARLVRDVSLHIMGAVRDLLAEVRQEPAPQRFFVPPREPKPGRPSDDPTADPIGGPVAGEAPDEGTGTGA